MMTSEDSEVTESVYEDSSRKAGFPPNPRRSRRRRARRASRERPKTATLPHPNILDETLKDKVDMTLTKKDLLAAVKLCNDGTTVHATTGTRTASNLARLRKLRQYSSADETGSSSGSAEQIYMPPKARRASSRAKLKSVPARPMTSRLERPSHSDLDVPNIRYYSKPKSLKARLTHKMKTEARKKLFSHPPETILEPCLSCGRTDQPERFHTHPLKEEKEPKTTHRQKSPLKENKLNNNNPKETDRTIGIVEENETLKEKDLPNQNRRPRRSQSPKKSVSPEKCVSPVTLPSETHSPQVKRKPKPVKLSEKENEIATIVEASKSPKKARHPKTKVDQETRPKHSNDFTVDIFTSKTSEEKENEKSQRTDLNKSEHIEEKKPAAKKQEQEKSVSAPAEDPEGGPVQASTRPVAVKCKTCGKEFGKASIKFHEPQCEKKKIADDLRKEKEKQAQEEKPVSYMDHLEEENLNDSFNAIWEAHMQQLIPCTLCGRTFFPDRIEVHQRSCKGITRGPKTADAQAGRPDLVKVSPEKLKKGKSPFVPEPKLSREIPIQYFISK